MSSSSSSNPTTLALGAVGAAGAAVLLTVLQSDAVSRRFFLSPPRLAQKRLQQFQYRWSRAVQRQKLKLRYYWNGGKIDSSDPTTSIFPTEAELDELVQQIVGQTKKKKHPQDEDAAAPFVVGTMARDEEHKSSDPQEYFVWLYQEASTRQVLQVPAALLGQKLADALETHAVRSTTFCFVADAAAGCGGRFVKELMTACCSDQVVCLEAVPAWLVQWALLSERRIYSREKLQRLLYALLRLEEMSVLHHAGSNNNNKSHPHTVVVPVPTALVPVLLPALHEAFPDDRHVFVYTGCVPTVMYAEQQQQPSWRGGSSNSTTLPTTLASAVSFPDALLLHTTPTNARLQQKAEHVMPPFQQTLAALPLATAGTVETWMAAVDAYLVRKQQQEQQQPFLPYVCKLDDCLGSSSSSNNNNNNMIEIGSPRYWSLRSLVQYVTGTASREWSDELRDAVLSWAQDYSLSALSQQTQPHPHQRPIENAVFQHKLILIAHKTLVDTVAPRQHWTLLAAKKGGCACCLPEDDPDGEAFFARRARIMVGGEDGAKKGGSLGAADSTAAASSVPPRTANRGYVDGKAGFAFDPTQFR